MGIRGQHHSRGLHFPETRLTVLGFGRDKRGEFKIIAEQPYIDGQPVSDDKIADYMRQMGFELKNPRNWTYATSDIYLSDMPIFKPAHYEMGDPGLLTGAMRAYYEALHWLTSSTAAAA